MGLTKSSVGMKANTELKISQNQYTVALAGNPNVGKSTLFNRLTGLNQHTGNWAGKTVTNASGIFRYNEKEFCLVDIPGTYSLISHSKEEEVARNFVCFDNPDSVVVVCDATSLERNLNLVLQIVEVCDKVIVCVNLMDEAKRKGIGIDIDLLSKLLGVPVVGCTARKRKSLKDFEIILEQSVTSETTSNFKIDYGEKTENMIALISKAVTDKNISERKRRWVALKLLENDADITEEIFKHVEINREELSGIREIIRLSGGKDKDSCKIIINKAKEIADKVTTYKKESYNARDRKIDKILTSRTFGYPIMILLLIFIFWLTISFSNYPSSILSNLAFFLEEKLRLALEYINTPPVIVNMVCEGVFRVLAWVVSVMLPPMAIFFPLFTLLEDLGYLPRIAFNLDKPFKKCNACGKQALTMCMGFGCNAAGVVGCRIIDSKRERLLATVTNSFVPCNGRFPMIISIITIFFVGVGGGLRKSIISSLILTLVILLGVSSTFLVTYILSKTLLKGEPSSYTLELPPYRKPQILSVLVHSVFDRTIFVLSRAMAVAAPAGLVIWLMSNITVDGNTLLSICAGFLDPLGKAIGLDGIILIAFILGFPANEIVIPIAIMGYLSTSSITDTASLSVLRDILISNGWSIKTAVCTVVFSLMHWPCSTTLLTIKKETASLKWTAVSFIVPTIFGMTLCFLINLIF